MVRKVQRTSRQVSLEIHASTPREKQEGLRGESLLTLKINFVKIFKICSDYILIFPVANHLVIIQQQVVHTGNGIMGEQ